MKKKIRSTFIIMRLICSIHSFEFIGKIHLVTRAYVWLSLCFVNVSFCPNVCHNTCNNRPFDGLDIGFKSIIAKHIRHFSLSLSFSRYVFNSSSPGLTIECDMEECSCGLHTVVRLCKANDIK